MQYQFWKEYNMFAVIMTGGKQYKVAAGDTIQVEKLDGDAGSKVTLDQVCCVFNDGKASFGSPVIAGASVTAEIVGHSRDRKIIIFKKRRRQNYRRKNGHRQHHTTLKITAISA